MKMISYAQNFEDVILWRVLRRVPCGFYVDVGAFHPEVDSVTKWFYDQGWSGINLEPVPDTFEKLKSGRPRDHNICAAAGEGPGKAQMTTFPSSLGLSTLDHGSAAAAAETFKTLMLDVEIVPLRDVLASRERQDIHFLKIDAEGTERQVLGGMDFRRFRPWIVLVEATAPRSTERNSAEWEGLVLGAGYRFAYFDGLNCFYLAEEHQDLAPLLTTPPNVFDEFELAATVRERAGRQAAEARRTVVEAELTALAAARDHLVTEVERLKAELASVRHDHARDAERLRDAAAATAALEKEAAMLGNALRAARVDLTALAEASKAKRAREAELRAELDRVSAEHHRLLRSRSWRWSAPLRHVRGLF